MKHLLWLDMEMTGLKVSEEVILEVACIITDFDFRELDHFHAVVHQSRDRMQKMDAWNTKHHAESGLTELVVNQGRRLDEIENELVLLVHRHFSEPAVLAGNSIGQDRLFINQYMPKLASQLHYRMLDVSSWKIVLNEKYKIKYNKKNNHRALDDIRESIGELKSYLALIEQGLRTCDKIT